MYITPEQVKSVELKNYNQFVLHSLYRPDLLIDESVRYSIVKQLNLLPYSSDYEIGCIKSLMKNYPVKFRYIESPLGQYAVNDWNYKGNLFLSFLDGLDEHTHIAFEYDGQSYHPSYKRDLFKQVFTLDLLYKRTGIRHSFLRFSHKHQLLYWSYNARLDIINCAVEDGIKS